MDSNYKEIYAFVKVSSDGVMTNVMGIRDKDGNGHPMISHSAKAASIGYPIAERICRQEVGSFKVLKFTLSEDVTEKVKLMSKNQI